MRTNRVKHKILRGIVRMGSPNGLRVTCLRKTGVSIGEDVYIGSNFTLASLLGFEKNLTIGDRVSIGPNVIIILTSDPNNSNLMKMKDTHPFICVRGRIHIKNDVWLGAGSIIMPNVTIGEYSIIGAGSVVLKDVPSYTVVAGVPARVVKKLEAGPEIRI